MMMCETRGMRRKRAKIHAAQHQHLSSHLRRATDGRHPTSGAANNAAAGAIVHLKLNAHVDLLLQQS